MRKYDTYDTPLPTRIGTHMFNVTGKKKTHNRFIRLIFLQL